MPKLLFQYNVRSCRIFTNLSFPNISPVIYGLSTYASVQGVYTIVYINGNNFSLEGSTVTFGSYTNIPIVFYSSQNISFEVPMIATPGTHTVTVVNNSQNPLYSNSVNYTIQINANSNQYIEQYV